MEGFPNCFQIILLNHLENKINNEEREDVNDDAEKYRYGDKDEDDQCTPQRWGREVRNWKCIGQ